jgi:hypothetical protein
MEPVSAFAFAPALTGGRGISLESILSTPPLAGTPAGAAGPYLDRDRGALRPWASSTPVMGRRKPVRPNLDALFAVPSAAIALQVGVEHPAHRAGLGRIPSS